MYCTVRLFLLYPFTIRFLCILCLCRCETHDLLTLKLLFCCNNKLFLFFLLLQNTMKHFWVYRSGKTIGFCFGRLLTVIWDEIKSWIKWALEVTLTLKQASSTEYISIVIYAIHDTSHFCTTSSRINWAITKIVWLIFVLLFCATESRSTPKRLTKLEIIMMTRFFFAITLVMVIFNRSSIQHKKENEIVVSYKTFSTSYMFV